jgi:2-methylcitrate dehydratase PrpD
VYACQWPNDALRQLVEQHDLRAGDILRIELLRPEAGAFCDCPRPRTVEEARSSFEYNLAAIALTGNAGLASFTEARLQDPAQLAMQRLIAVTGHPPGTPPSHTWRYLVRVHTRNDGTLENWVRYPSGHPRNPLSGAEVRAKWAECTDGHLGRDAVAELDRLIDDLEGQPTLGEIGGLLRTAR